MLNEPPGQSAHGGCSVRCGGRARRVRFSGGRQAGRRLPAARAVPAPACGRCWHGPMAMLAAAASWTKPQGAHTLAPALSRHRVMMAGLCVCPQPFMGRPHLIPVVGCTVGVWGKACALPERAWGASAVQLQADPHAEVCTADVTGSSWMGARAGSEYRRLSSGGERSVAAGGSFPGRWSLASRPSLIHCCSPTLAQVDDLHTPGSGCHSSM